jgi:hypothetical protein
MSCKMCLSQLKFLVYNMICIFDIIKFTFFGGPHEHFSLDLPLSLIQPSGKPTTKPHNNHFLNIQPKGYCTTFHSDHELAFIFYILCFFLDVWIELLSYCCLILWKLKIKSLTSHLKRVFSECCFRVSCSLLWNSRVVYSKEKVRFFVELLWRWL